MFVNAAGGSGNVIKYPISNSLRFRGAQYLSRTFATPTNNTTWSWSGWVKRGSLGSWMTLFNSFSGGDGFAFSPTNNLILSRNNIEVATSSAVFRDPTAHMHVFVRSNGTNVKGFVNDVEVVSYTGTVPQLNSALVHHLGSYAGTGNYFDGYLSEINFIDGQALNPTNFGETNEHGVWVPKRYTGTYGNNGFYLDFKDGALTSGSNTGLGKDVSGNTNYWNTNGISVTPGVTYDWMLDTPTNNFATLNYLNKSLADITLNNTNLGMYGTAANTLASVQSTIVIPSTQKIYCEFTFTGTSNHDNRVALVRSHIFPANGVSNAYGSPSPDSEALAFRGSGVIIRNGVDLITGLGTFTSGQVGMIAFDPVSRKVWMGKEGTWWNSGNPSAGTGEVGTLVSGYEWTIGVTSTSGAPTTFLNFGQYPFATSSSYYSAAGGYFRYEPPTGFRALCTANFPNNTITKPKEHFDILTHTATGSGTQNVTGTSFEPDLVWAKARNDSYNHVLVDRLRGVNKVLSSNLTDLETTNDTVSAFLSNGFTAAGIDNDNFSLNAGSRTYIDWLWKAGGAGTTNIDGSIISTVSVNRTAGFSIVTYTGTGSPVTVGHGLAAIPKMIIIKGKNYSGANSNWLVNDISTSWTGALTLNTPNPTTPDSNFYNNTAPSTSVFSLGSNVNCNANTYQYIAYCFAEVPGFSKFGRYTGNGSTDGPFVWCGFRPRFILLKRTDSADNWVIFDSARSTYNVTQAQLYPNLVNAEDTNRSIDVLSNGFKIRDTSSGINSGTIIFAAFAEYPFGGANVAPSPAR